MLYRYVRWQAGRRRDSFRLPEQSIGVAVAGLFRQQVMRVEDSYPKCFNAEVGSASEREGDAVAGWAMICFQKDLPRKCTDSIPRRASALSKRDSLLSDALPAFTQNFGEWAYGCERGGDGITRDAAKAGRLRLCGHLRAPREICSMLQ